MVDGNLFPYTGAITFADPSYNPTTGHVPAARDREQSRPACCARTSTCACGSRARSGRTRSSSRSAPCSKAPRATSSGWSTRRTRPSCVPVVVGEWKGEGWLISEGLNDGDKVVVDGGVRLTQGAPVKAAAVRAAGRADGDAREGHGAEPPYPAAAPSSVAIYFPTGTVDARRGRAARGAHRGGRVRRHRHADRRSPATPTRPATPRPTSSSRRSARTAVRDELVTAGRRAQAHRARAAGQRHRQRQRRPGAPGRRRRRSNRPAAPACSRGSSSSARSSRRSSR